MKQELLDKYNVPVPRYTSYPPANYFHDGFTSRDYADAIRESNRQQPESVSFYFHIPFCQRLCLYSTRNVKSRRSITAEEPRHFFRLLS